MRRKKYVTILIPAILIFLLLVSMYHWRMEILNAVAGFIAEEQEKHREYPQQGEYYSDELNATLCFSPEENRLCYPDGEVAVFLTNYYRNRFVANHGNPSTDFCATYFWDQKDDIMKLTFQSYPGEFDQSKSYVFVKAQE